MYKPIALKVTRISQKVMTSPTVISVHEREAQLREWLSVFRILAALFITNAIVSTVTYWLFNDSRSQLIAFWILGIASGAIYYASIACVGAYYKQEMASRQQQKLHHLRPTLTTSLAVHEREAQLREWLSVFRVLAALFIANAIVSTVTYIFFSDSKQQLIAFWIFGVVAGAVYYVSIACVSAYYRQEVMLRQNQRQLLHAHHRHTKNEKQQQQYQFSSSSQSIPSSSTTVIEINPITAIKNILYSESPSASISPGGGGGYTSDTNVTKLSPLPQQTHTRIVSMPVTTQDKHKPGHASITVYKLQQT